ncbi:MAG TPA: class I tRNA ligase family protein, partial [Candidatus Paceibacterota bacterium]|nr:class I tRNA ligase family protein [Candidatus Paceibacterota bacterium]
SCWWALSEMDKKGLLYESTRVLPYCPRCETPIANAEIAMDNSYKDISDISAYVKFELVDEPGVYVLAWTTTPWTLPGNVALAVGSEIDYVLVEKDGARYFAAEALAAKIFKKGYAVVRNLKGSELVGKGYKPLFDYYAKQAPVNAERGWKIYGADFVTTTDGTGIVHIAPAFGDDDMKLARTEKLPEISHVTPTGVFKDEFSAEGSEERFAGVPVKPKGDHQSADILMIKYLAHQGALFAKEKITHSYPHCFRCETPLYYYAIPAWFIKIQDLKPRLQGLNATINWIPGHLKHGRFEKSMEGAPDWNISRNRFWATPLPIWKCSSCQAKEVIPSVEGLRKRSANRIKSYAVMRHGEAEHNVKHLVSCVVGNPHHLTEAGKEKARLTAEGLKGQGIDLIIASDFVRTRETAEIAARALGLPVESIVYDERLREVNFGKLNGKSFEEFHTYLDALPDKFSTPFAGGESYMDVRQRIGSFIYDIHDRYADRNPLLITHESLVWLLHSVSRGMSVEESLQEKGYLRSDFLLPGEMVRVDFAPLPHNRNYELDLHRPYIDEIKLACSCGGEMSRIVEVVDCWFESGSMPFAAEHYPFENEEKFKSRFPGQFVAEYIAQTRTWFYYMHAVSTILFDDKPFENVVTTGTVLAEDGEKMSKSKGNFPDPWILFNKFGVDAVRFYLLSSPIMKSEDLNFSEKGVGEIYRKIIMRLDNTHAFYAMYAGKERPSTIRSGNVLDRWITARLSETVAQVESAMDAYELDRALRPIDEFIDGLSNWYVRRSRDRFKSDDEADREMAISTLRAVLLDLAKVMAPFTPFVAEDMHRKLGGSEESVHLASWPKAESADQGILEAMAETRRVVSLGLEARAKAGIKVRQPLGRLSVKSAIAEAYHPLIALEVNVKEVIVDPSLVEDVLLDTVITDELRDEGIVRELARHIQEERKKRGYVPQDLVLVAVATDDLAGQRIVKDYGSELAKAVNAKSLSTAASLAEDGKFQVTVENIVFDIAMEK